MSRRIAALFLVAIGVDLGRAWAADEPNAIYTMSINGENVRKLAQVEGCHEHAAPRWSRDGNFVAFDAVPAGGGRRTCFTIAADGSALREIGAGAMPSFSPDGKQLAFQVTGDDGSASIVVQNLDGQGRVEIASGMGPCWSPDGGRLALSDGQMLRVIDLVTSEEAALFNEPFFEVFSGADWSPDGRRLAVAVRPAAGAQRQLLFVSAEGAAKDVTVRMNSNLDGFVSFSPDGSRIAYSTNNTIHIARVRHGEPSRIVPGQRGKNRNPDWSPNGKMIVFASNRDVP